MAQLDIESEKAEERRYLGFSESSGFYASAGLIRAVPHRFGSLPSGTGFLCWWLTSNKCYTPPFSLPALHRRLFPVISVILPRETAPARP